MGITLTIGNAVFGPSGDPDVPDRWNVQPIVRHDMPSAWCSPLLMSNMSEWSYTSFDEFLVATELKDFLVNEQTGLVRAHPGVVFLTPDHLERLNVIFNSLTSARREGLEERHRADCFWLASWMEWALVHCAQPAIMNR